MSNHLQDTAKVAPPAVVAALSHFGITVPETIQFFTLIYAIGLVVQQGYRFFRFVSGWLERRKARAGS